MKTRAFGISALTMALLATFCMNISPAEARKYGDRLYSGVNYSGNLNGNFNNNLGANLNNNCNFNQNRGRGNGRHHHRRNRNMSANNFNNNLAYNQAYSGQYVNGLPVLNGGAYGAIPNQFNNLNGYGYNNGFNNSGFNNNGYVNRVRGILGF